MTRRPHAHVRTYYPVFTETYGNGPYDCFFCGGVIDGTDLNVHHMDYDSFNNDPENLVPSHESCHLGHHAQQRTYSEETRLKLSQASKGRSKSKQMRERLSATNTGKPKSPEHVANWLASRRASGVWPNGSEQRRGIPTGPHTPEAKQKMREAALARPLVSCPECGMESNPGGLARHRKARGH